MKAMQECPRFDICSVNDCPLDDNANAITLKIDPETKCKANRKARVRIAAEFNLQNNGLTKKEIKSDKRKRKAKARFANLPFEERERIKNRLKYSHINKFKTQKQAK